MGNEPRRGFLLASKTGGDVVFGWDRAPVLETLTLLLLLIVSLTTFGSLVTSSMSFGSLSITVGEPEACVCLGDFGGCAWLVDGVVEMVDDKVG